MKFKVPKKCLYWKCNVRTVEGRTKYKNAQIKLGGPDLILFLDNQAHLLSEYPKKNTFYIIRKDI